MSEKKLADVSTAALKRRGGAPQGPRLVPALTIASHPNPRRVSERLLLDLATGSELALSRNHPDFTRPGSNVGMPLGDPFVSRKPIVFSRVGENRLRLSVEDGGTQVVVGEPIVGGRELGPDELAAGVPLELAERVVLLLHLALVGEDAPADSLGMVGESPGVQRARRYILQVADLDVPVLIRGETGTGKELVAQALHERSPRRSAPFLKVNLGAIPKELAAAELFGTQKGAYTGATRDREGFFRAAQGGTLFLDEVGEAPPEVQVMLLRALETGEIFPVGGQAPVSVNVRLIAATDADLEARIRDGQFKAPLLHRLASYEIRVPPLRERREDIGLLIHHFARLELEALGEAVRLAPEDPYAEPWMPASLMARLLRFSWPGNIRQLRNVVRQLVIASRGQPRLQVDPALDRELGPATAAAPGLPSSSSEAAQTPPVARRKPSEITEEQLLAALRECAWDLKATADQLSLPRTSLYDMIEKSPNIRTAGDLSADEIKRCFHECQGALDAMVKRLEVSKQALRRRIKELGLSPRET